MDDAWQNDFPIREVGQFTAMVVIIAMAVLYWQFHGSAAPDWDGYQRLYDDEGGWLLATGHDPTFVWFIQTARHVFGQNGYDDFRLALFCVFGLFAVWLACAIPEQPFWGTASPLVNGLIVVCAFFLKSLVQVREGLAFLFILIPLVAMYERERRGVLGSGVNAAIAASIHSGTALLSATWGAAALLWIAPTEFLNGRGPKHVLLLAGIVAGLGVGYWALTNDQAVYWLLQDFGVDESADVESGYLKYAYWIGYGVAVVALRYQVLEAVRGIHGKFPYAFAAVLASFLLPLAYTAAAFLVFTNFHIPALTAMVIRFLLTSTELALLIVALRGRATMITAAIAAVLLVDQARLLKDAMF